MAIIIIKIVVIVGLTHGLRWLSQKAGPRWGGLIAGLPSTSAVMLFFLACENGEEYATHAASSGAVGLCGGSALALAFSWAAARGRSMSFALAYAGISFLGVATIVPAILSLTAPMPLFLVISACCLLAAMALSMPASTCSHAASSKQSSWRGMILRTIIPAACVVSVTMLSQRLGTVMTGLLGTFPCMLTSMLVVTSLEDGVPVAGKLAQVFPVGQLATLSFVIVFGLVCLITGVTGALILGFLAAIATLGTLECFSRVQHVIRKMESREVAAVS